MQPGSSPLKGSVVVVVVVVVLVVVGPKYFIQTHVLDLFMVADANSWSIQMSPLDGSPAMPPKSPQRLRPLGSSRTYFARPSFSSPTACMVPAPSVVARPV